VGIYNLFNFANFNLPPTTMFGAWAQDRARLTKPRGQINKRSGSATARVVFARFATAT
jgi:hypothetical protein